ncbi:MAG: adenylosuccinate lyase [Cyanobacteriota bacterium]|nr:adenylosuccinate lyase [Cyanobacteriota bacterium]MDY6358798.1 adenylosuccinate lyase [Cyanobacteriota bacterium]MDY6364641.1 adenylosuccinate lyase [Cyanobacteriota bacterium]MDY6383179.1 adenylosuccinate lyase [Cyanobacteriota bacterium]
MIDRYSREEISKIWKLDSKFQYYLNVELAVCDAYAQIGRFPKDVVKEIRKKAKFNVKRIDEIEREVKHDVIAFLTCVNESLGDLGRYVHVGMTSSDVIDTAFALQIQDSAKIIHKDLEILISTLKKLADKHRKTLCIGRSHGVHAEVMTFGVKLCNWIDILQRQKENFEQATEQIRVGQISGPVGTYSNIPPEIEQIACKNLGLKPARISTQIIARDYHAHFMQSLALIAAVIEQFATEIRHLQRTEVLELEERFSKGQKGSSAMPHKKNPVLSENLCGLSRVVRSNSIAALENVVLWHERDISHSSAERIIFPDSLTLVDFMLNRFNNIMGNIVVHKDNMLSHCEEFGGIVYSQKLLLKLVEKGLTREDAYAIVQKDALDAFNNHGNFKKDVTSDKKVLKYLTEKDIEDVFNPHEFLKNIDKIYERVLG